MFWSSWLCLFLQFFTNKSGGAGGITSCISAHFARWFIKVYYGWLKRALASKRKRNKNVRAKPEPITHTPTTPTTNTINLIQKWKKPEATRATSFGLARMKGRLSPMWKEEDTLVCADLGCAPTVAPQAPLQKHLKFYFSPAWVQLWWRGLGMNRRGNEGWMKEDGMSRMRK